MKKLTLIMALLVLTGCRTNTSYDMLRETAPGAALPAGLAVCLERDEYARCKAWSSKSDLCNSQTEYGIPAPCSQVQKQTKPQYEF